MPLNADIRQAIVIALQSQGTEVVGQLEDALKGLQGSLDVLGEAYSEGSVEGDKFIASASKNLAAQRGLKDQIAITKQELEGFSAATSATLIPLEKLIVTGLKWQDTLDKIAARKDAANAKALADADGFEAMQRKLGEMEKRAQQEAREGIDSTTAARQHGTEAIADHIVKAREEGQAIQAAALSAASAMDKEEAELEQLNQGLITHAQDVGMATRATREQIQALKDMGVIQETVTTKVSAGKGQFGGFATAADQAANKAQRMGQNMMSIAYAMDDVRYGIGAVINNVPMLTQAFGASATWAASISIGSIAVYELGKAMAPVAEQFARDWGVMTDDSKMFVSSVEDAKKKLEGLQAKPYKVSIDYDEIAQAERTLEIMQERLNAFRSGRKDNLSEEASRQAKDATHSYGGGTEAMRKAVAETEAVGGFSHAEQGDVDQLKALREGLKRAEEKEAAGQADEHVYEAMAHAKRRIEDLDHKIKKAEADWATQEVGAFETGDFQAIQRMQARARKTPGAFARAGPGGITTAEAIANVPSTPEETLRRIDEDDTLKDLEEHDKETSARFKHKRADDKKTRTSNESVDQAVEDYNHDIEDVGRLDRKHAEAEAKKAATAQGVEGRRIAGQAAKGARAAGAEAHKAGGEVGKGYIPQIQGALAENQMQGGNQAALLAQMEGYLRSQGASAGVAADVVGRGLAEFNKVAQQHFATIGDTQQALVATMQDAINDQRALGMGLQQVMAKAQMQAGQSNRNRQRGVTRGATFNGGQY